MHKLVVTRYNHKPKIGNAWLPKIKKELTQSFRENEDQDHTDEQAGLLSVSADTSITDNTNGHTGGQGGHTWKNENERAMHAGIDFLLSHQIQKLHV